jgi:restriction system protein
MHQFSSYVESNRAITIESMSRLIIRISLAWLALACAAPASAQNATGHWDGALTVGTSDHALSVPLDASIDISSAGVVSGTLERCQIDGKVQTPEKSFSLVSFKLIGCGNGALPLSIVSYTGSVARLSSAPSQLQWQGNSTAFTPTSSGAQVLITFKGALTAGAARAGAQTKAAQLAAKVPSPSLPWGTIFLAFGGLALVSYIKKNGGVGPRRQRQSSAAVFRTRTEPYQNEPAADPVRREPINDTALLDYMARCSGVVPKPQSWSLDLLRTIEWKRFEEVVAAWYREKGYRCDTNPFGADGGIDATIYKDDQLVAVVQCKAWNTRPVGVAPIREFYGVMMHQKVPKGYFMITGEFSDEAKKFAESIAITLVSGFALYQTIERLDADAQQRLLAVATEGDYTTPTCPSCGIKTVRRESGTKKFWGCINYPRCKTKIFSA